MPTLDLPSGGGMSNPDSGPQSPSTSDSGFSYSSLPPWTEDCPCKLVQRGYLFLRDHLHEEEQLIGYLCIVCGRQQLTDDERVKMREGGVCSIKEKLLKELIRKGSEPCEQFLGKLEACPCLFTRFCQNVESQRNIAITEVWQTKVDLTAEKLEYHGAVLVEEMEPSLVSNELFSLCIMSVADHDEIEKETTRKLKAKKLIEKIGPLQYRIQAFYHALKVTQCAKALQHIKDNVCRRDACVPSESIRCVRFNYRNLLDEFKRVERRRIAFNYMEMQNMLSNGRPMEENHHFVKTGLRKEKLGCDDLLTFLEWIHNGFLSRITQRLTNRKQRGQMHFVK